MLTEREEAFLKYWGANRDRLGGLKYQVLTGLPFSLVIGVLYWGAIKLMFYLGWFTRDEMVYNSGSYSVVILLAILIFGIFFSVYSKKFKWEKNESFYQSLLSRKNKYSTNLTDQTNNQ